MVYSWENICLFDVGKKKNAIFHYRTDQDGPKFLKSDDSLYSALEARRHTDVNNWSTVFINYTLLQRILKHFVFIEVC